MLAGWALAWPSGARGDCASDAHLSTCFDADNAWPHPGPGFFDLIGGGTTTPPGTFGLGLYATYLARPVVLVLPSVDPSGAEVVAVVRLADATVLFSLGLTSRLEATIALPVAVYRTGVGISPVTSQHSTPLAHG